jgi:hypothetical protein
MLPLFLFMFTLFEQTYNTVFIYTTRRVPSCPHGFRSVEGLLWGAEPRFELRPAVQEADALLTEPPPHPK